VDILLAVEYAPVLAEAPVALLPPLEEEVAADVAEEATLALRKCSSDVVSPFVLSGSSITAELALGSSELFACCGAGLKLVGGMTPSPALASFPLGSKSSTSGPLISMTFSLGIGCGLSKLLPSGAAPGSTFACLPASRFAWSGCLKMPLNAAPIFPPDALLSFRAGFSCALFRMPPLEGAPDVGEEMSREELPPLLLVSASLALEEEDSVLPREMVLLIGGDWMVVILADCNLA